jgi:nucleotide-binding universal stress UspA family protein
MATKIIVSYDGTHNEDDAIAFGRVLAEAGADVALAYVRHAQSDNPDVEQRQQSEAEAALERGAKVLGNQNAQRHVVVSGSTPAGLATLAEREGAQLIVFCSDSHTAPGHVSVGNSARRLIEGGNTAVAIVPSGYGRNAQRPNRVAATGSPADSSAEDTAASLAQSFGANVVSLAGEGVDLVVVGSRPEVAEGRVGINSSSEYLLEVARSPVVILPRNVALSISGTGRSQHVNA